MRPIVVRALTAALATGGAVWAIVLPTLTLGEARSPSHAFAIPAVGGELVIEASRPATPLTVHLTRSTAPRATARHAPTRAIIVLAAPAPRTAPRTQSRPATTPVSRAVPAASPKPPAPTPSPTPAPQPQPQPAPEPTVVRALASVAVPAQPTRAADDDSEQKKQRKDKPQKQKPKPDKARKNDVVPQAAPPAADPVTPVEPVAPAAVDVASQAEPEQDEASDDDHGKEHGSHGKGHDKKK
jgi:hypothetical protein